MRWKVCDPEKLWLSYVLTVIGATKFGFINLSHAKCTNVLMSNDILRLGSDIVELNEPYFLDSRIVDFQRNMNIITAKNNLIAAILLNNKWLKVNTILIQRDAIVFSIETW